MWRKRRNTSSPELSPPPSRKHASPAVISDDDADSADDPQGSDERPRTNTHFGQTGAFPGLGSVDDGELFYGPANDGIGYLRMVRSEALGVPTLLLAPRVDDGTEDQAQDEDDAGGYWEDETFIAAPQATTFDDLTSRLCTAQLRYYESLLAQFRLLQATLRCTPPLAAVQALPTDRPISLPAESTKAANMWEQHITNDDPSMVQMASMDTDSVWELVKLLGNILEKIKRSPRRAGAWIWATLGKCPERGMCMSEEVSELRALARKAVEMLDDSDSGYEPVEVNEFPAGNLSRAASDQPTKEWTTSGMVLDMIITIVGEVYGQRDLLEQRRVWQTPEA